MKSQENKTEQEEMSKIRNETVVLTFMKRTTNCTPFLPFQATGKIRDFKG